MPYFISPLSSQLTVEHKLSWFFFSHNLVFPSDLPFSVCRHVSPSLSLSRYLSLFSLTSPFRRICHGNVKNLSCSNSFRALSVEKEGQFCFSSLLSVCCGLKVMKTIFHLHGVIWLGVAEKVCYGKINIMEGLTLLSLSHWDQCVYYWTGYITQTRRHACNVHTFRAKLYIEYANIHTHKGEIHTGNPFLPKSTPSPILSVLWLCLYECVCAFTCVCIHMCVCLPASHWML